MKKLLTIILLGIVITGMGQTIPKQILNTEVYTDCITINQLLQYGKECYNDTIVAKKYIEDGYIWFFIEHDKYITEAVTEIQLKKRGYEYSHLWVWEYPDDIRYYFVKEPTLKGFLKWIKNNK